LFDTAGTGLAEGAQSPAYSPLATNPLTERGDLIQELQQETGVTVLLAPHSL